jgi:glycine cleavage system H protein
MRRSAAKLSNRTKRSKTPELINEAPWDTWFVKIDMADSAELDALLDEDAYKAFCEEE